MMIGSLIQNQFGSARNWPFGSALAFVLLVLVLLGMLGYARRFKRAVPT
jgi:spermidine/putrescine transport system permease protein